MDSPRSFRVRLLRASLVVALFGASAAYSQTPVVNYSDTWKFNIPTQDPGAGWRGPGFDDSSWASGPGFLGHEPDWAPSPAYPNIATAVGTSGNGRITYLFRKPFTYNGSPAGVTFSIDHYIDDGVTYYLNGTRLGSVRHDPGAWDNVATSPAVNNATEELNILSGSAVGLVTGQNVLSAEVHQAGSTSSDMVFAARLKLTPPAQTTPGGTIEHVIFISVDGLRGHFIQNFIETAPAEFPNFVRLRDASAYTFNARCDWGQSVTIPNHLCMLTGRPINQPAGLPNTVHHGYTENFPAPGDTVHLQGNPAVPYKFSVYDVVHDRGLSTGLYLDKVKLTICQTSYGDAGGPDTVGVDNGTNKIDNTQIVNYTPEVLAATIAGRIAGNLESYLFWHIAIVDLAGHSSGWRTDVNSEYRNAVKTVDTHLGTILNALAANSSLTGKVAIVLTADHGGGGDVDSIINHGKFDAVENYTIPFFISGPGFVPGSDLYPYFQNRVNPGTGRPAYTDADQPIRNGDAANLSTALLGLPVVPGSLMQPSLKQAIGISHTSNSISVVWPSYLTGYTLESTSDLTSTTAWTQLLTGIVTAGPNRNYTRSFPSSARFYRVRKPAGN